MIRVLIFEVTGLNNNLYFWFVLGRLVVFWYLGFLSFFLLRLRVFKMDRDVVRKNGGLLMHFSGRSETGGGFFFRTQRVFFFFFLSILIKMDFSFCRGYISGCGISFCYGGFKGNPCTKLL